MSTKPTPPTLDETVAALVFLLEQVDDDCPQEYRSKHLRDAMYEANNLIRNYNYTKRNETWNTSSSAISTAP